MSNSKKEYLVLFMIGVSVLLLTWCSSEKVDNGEFIIQNSEAIDSAEVDKNLEIAENLEQSLVIRNWCVWCGKCVKTSPKNFTMEWKKAVVYSQDDIDSSSVQKAINWCPVSVIEIIGN